MEEQPATKPQIIPAEVKLQTVQEQPPATKMESINTLAYHLSMFMTNKMTLSLFCLLSIVFLIILFLTYKMSSYQMNYYPDNTGPKSFFCNRPYDF